MDAILYTSNTGFTERYAKMLAEKTGLPVYALDKSPVPTGAEIIYLGWVMASGVKGYKKAAKKYKVKALCGVCMATTGSQIAELRKANSVPANMPVFTMQGGFDITKLHGMYRFMMNTMVKTAGKGLKNKTDRTPEEDEMLEMMLHGGDSVSEEHMKAILNWYREQK